MFSPPSPNHEEDYHEIDVIVGRRTSADGTEYKVRWLGYTEQDDSWIRDEDLTVGGKQFADEWDLTNCDSTTEEKPSPRKRKCNSYPPVLERAKWTIPNNEGCSSSLLVAGGMSIHTLVHSPVTHANTKPSFASYYFGNRLLQIETTMTQRQASETAAAIPPNEITVSNIVYQLLSAKVKKDDGPTSGVTSHFRGISSTVRFTYVGVSGPGLQTISLQNELDSIADFSSIYPPTKAKSRLELLVSASNTGVIVGDMKSTDFIIFEENTCGCGFMPEGMFDRFLEGKRANAIVVRVISPKLGIFKGTFCPKPGISQIELSRSMQKVKPSRVVGAKDWACVVLKVLHPTTKNHQIGRQLGTSQDTPPMSYFTGRKQNVPKMIDELWQCLGVPVNKIAEYSKKCNNRNSIRGLKHAYLVGLADPTNRLPKGLAFVTGMGRDIGVRSNVFATRMPCVEPSDGRMLRVVQTKPKAMQEKDWDWLNSLPFGMLVFGAPRGNQIPTPELIAGGDLDGDLYFICWDSTIVDSIVPMHHVNHDLDCNLIKPQELSRNESRANWLSAAQDAMLDVNTACKLSQLTGKLFNARLRVAKKSPNGLKDPQAIRLARAYKASLDLPKHGGKISVPESLLDHIPRSLHEYFDGKVKSKISKPKKKDAAKKQGRGT